LLLGIVISNKKKSLIKKWAEKKARNLFSLSQKSCIFILSFFSILHDDDDDLNKRILFRCMQEKTKKKKPSAASAQNALSLTRSRRA
jgi:hypothetical protein